MYVPPNTKPILALSRDMIDAMHNLCVTEDHILDLSSEMGDDAPYAVKHCADRIRVGRMHAHDTYKKFQDADYLRPVIPLPKPQPPADQPQRRRWWNRRG